MRLRSPWPGGAGVKPHQSAPRPHAVPPTHSRDTTKENTATSDHRHRVRPNLEAAETAELQLEPPRAGHLPRGGRGSHTRWHRHRPFSWGALSSGTRRPCPRFHRGVRIPGSQGDPHLYGGRHTSTHSTRTHTHMHVHMHTWVLSHMCLHSHLCTHAHTQMHVHTHTHACICMGAHVHTHMDVHANKHTHVPACAHTHGHICACTRTQRLPTYKQRKLHHPGSGCGPRTQRGAIPQEEGKPALPLEFPLAPPPPRRRLPS